MPRPSGSGSRFRRGKLVGGVVATGVTVGCHCYDTRNTGLANAVAAVESGAAVLAAAVGWPGGCPALDAHDWQ